MKSVFIGDPALFAIELSEPAKTAGLRLHVEGRAYGDFKVRDDLTESIHDFGSLVQHIDSLSEPAIEGKSAEFVFDWILNTGDHAEFQRRRRYIRFMGEQMDSVTMFSYLRNGRLDWAFRHNRAQNQRLHVHSIDKKVVVAVARAYIGWYRKS